MKKTLWMGLVLPFFWIGCSSGPYLPEADPKSPEAAGKKVVLFDEDLEEMIGVDHPPIATRNAQNYLTVQASLRNRSSKTVPIQVQTLFKDAKGMILYNDLGNEVAWQSMVLSANETKSLTQNAMTPEATQYIIRVRLMNRPKN